MQRKCFTCKKMIENDDFICPHCGAILGDPVSYAAISYDSKTKERKTRMRRNLLALLAVLLLAGACTAGFFLRRSMASTQPSDSTTVPAATVPQATQPTAPLAVYSARVTAENKTDLAGATAHICKDGQVIYSGQIDKNGDVTFIVPESEGYSIKLTDLPVQFQINYEDVVFPFKEGEHHQLVTLECEPVPFTIKFVNSSGEPVPGVGLVFYSSGEESQQQVSDDSGCCTFMTEYGDGNQLTHSVYISFVPNGYYVRYPSFGFHKDRLEFEFELQTYEEAGIDPEDIYTVRVVDEYGEPASHISLSVHGMITDGLSGDRYSGVTNMEGCFTFCYDRNADISWKIRVLNNIDYYDTVFDFVAGTREMLLELDLHREPGEEYTYTVQVNDQFGEGVAGVQIAYTHNDGTIGHYTSDKNGVIRFQTEEADPANVKFYVTSLPKDYVTNRPVDALYSFRSYSRSLSITLLYEGDVDYTITVVDNEGEPIKGAKIEVSGDGKVYNDRTDEHGRCVFRLSALYSYRVVIYSLPDAYSHLEFKPFWIGAYPKEITVRPATENDSMSTTG